MATSKTAAAGEAKPAARKASTKKKKLDPSEIPTYTHLRLILDGFEAVALQHFLNGKDAADRKKRAQQVGKVVKSFQKNVIKKNGGTHCPMGLCSCDNTCIPCGVICPGENYY